VCRSVGRDSVSHKMKFTVSGKVRAGIGLALVAISGVRLYYYLLNHPVRINITSKSLGAIVLLVFLIVFVVLPVYSIIVTREIRKRRRVEKALIQAKEEAERASKFKDRFLSTMSHELRTPLNAVLGFSDLLLDKRCGELNERQKRYIAHINSGGKHLLKLISDILDLSKIEAGRMEISCQDLSVASIFGEVVSALRPLAEKKKQTLSANAERDLAVHADATRFKQILMNLVGNAIKFTPEDGRIELAAQPSNGKVQIKVRDNGPGIPAEERARVFEPYYRVRETAALGPGTGLGLSVVRSLVEAHGGTVRADAAPGAGTRMTVILPALP